VARTEKGRPTVTGAGDVLQLLRQEGPLTRTEIQDRSGFSRVTVGHRVAALLEHGLLSEGEERASSGGRPATALRFNTDHGVFAVAALETTRTRIALTDLGGAILAEADVDLRVGAGPEHCLRAVEEGIDELLGARTPSSAPLRGVGISLPGPVDPGTQRPSEPPIMPGWDAYPVADRVQDRFGVPVVVDNDANVMALGEQRERYAAAQSLVLVKVSTGIGAGIVIDGRLHRGVDGGAGDIGHTRVGDSDGELCRCGNRGCLAAYASGAAVARRLSTPEHVLEAGHEVRDLLDAGDPQAVAAVAEAGESIGVVLAGMVSMLNPTVLVLAGDLASTALLGGVRASLYRLTLPRATRRMEIVLGRPGSAGRGLAAALVDKAFAPAVVDAALQS
jgi:predicted NBD/HSP70 family sugar kinase